MKKVASLMLVAVLVVALLGFAYADDSGINARTGANSDAGGGSLISTYAGANASVNYRDGSQNQTQEREAEMNQSQTREQERLMHPLNDGGQSEHENESVYSYQGENGSRNQITVRSRVGNDGEVENEVEMHGYNVSVAQGLGVNFSGYGNGSGIMMKARLSDGQEKDVKVLPDVASQTAISKFQSRNISVVLKQVGNGTNASLVYEASTNKTVALLGLFRVRAMLQAQINATNGEVMHYSQPWWYFLAFGGSGNVTSSGNETNASVNESSNMNTPEVNQTVNESMITLYPALNSSAFLSSPIGLINSTMNVNGQVVGYNSTTNMFSCNNHNFAAIHVASYSPGNGLVGGFYDTYVVDCGNFYLVYNPGDAGPRIYGPFVK